MDDNDDRLKAFDQPDIESPPVPEMPDVTDPDIPALDEMGNPLADDAPDSDFGDGDQKKDAGW